ncbi:hypothetical protein [Labedaea rhizosphaerae]|uniref:Uncharacterized protein n=1 Tax=Labedaea rhizosphaerae TaxID=598644 RepID=A0A4V3CZV8_LABRH|nr:hypothetical protein [Labedaea rhizosphaerae]TDQ01251.1 hypothetical protein EV186_1021119 [Labedaea rhizosphaerae]
MRFVNDIYPELVIADLGVRFTGGQAEVDTKTAALLRKLPPELGVRPASDTASDLGANPDVPKPDAKARPSGRRDG